MIRKAIIVVLTLAAIGTAALWVRPANLTVSGGTLPHWCGFGLLDRASTPVPCVLGYCGYRGFAVDLGRYGGVSFWGNFVIPFWAAFLLLSIYPAIVAIRGTVRRYRRHRLVIAGASFLLSMVVANYVLNMVEYGLLEGGDGIKALGRSLGSEDVALAGLLVLPLAASFVVARTVYGKLGKCSDRSCPYCHNCGYNLTGNESGVCSECGRAIDS